MSRRLVPLVLAFGALLLAACEEGEAPVTPEPTPTAAPTVEASPTPHGTPVTTPTPEPTPASEPIALDEDRLPVGAVGPLLVYAAPSERQDPHGELQYYKVFLYDAGAGAHIGSFEVAQRPLLAGREILVAYDQSVDAYRLDGSRDRTVVEAEDEERLGAATVSPDGALLAFSRGYVGAIHIIEVETGREVTDLDVPALPLDLDWPTPCCWAADTTRLFTIGNTESTAPGTLRALTLDGELQSFGLSERGTDDSSERRFEMGMVDPAGSRFAFGDGSPLVYGGPPHDNLRILDLRDGTELTIAESDELGFRPGEWAPDGSALLYEVIEPDSDGSFDGLTVSEIRLYHVASGEDSEAPPLSELRAEWYGERAVVFECGDGQPPETRWLSWYASPEPRMLAECRGGATTILLDGDPIDEVRDPRILGWVEVAE